MADMKKYLDLAGLGTYDSKIKAYIEDKDDAALAAAKTYTDTQIGELGVGMQDVASAIAAEADRAKAAEKANADAIAAEANRAKAAEEANAAAAKAAQDDVDALEGFVGTLPEDAVATTVVAYATEVATAKATAVQNDLNGYKTSNDTAVQNAQKAADDAQADVNALKAKVGEIPSKNVGGEQVPVAATVVDYVGVKVAEINGNASALADRVTANENAIAIINGNDKTEGSIAKAAKDAAASAVATVVADAPEAFDTLKEIAQWIDKNGGEGFDAAQRIQNLETAVGKEAVGETPATGLTKDVRDLQAAIGEGGSVAAQINAAIEALDVDAQGGEGKYIKSISETNGKIAVTLGNTSEFDVAGAAKAVQGDTTMTVAAVEAHAAAVEAKVDAFTAITENEINALFAPAQNG